MCDRGKAIAGFLCLQRIMRVYISLVVLSLLLVAEAAAVHRRGASEGEEYGYYSHESSESNGICASTIHDLSMGPGKGYSLTTCYDSKPACDIFCMMKISLANPIITVINYLWYLHRI